MNAAIAASVKRVVVGLDVKKRALRGGYQVYTHNGRKVTGTDLVKVAAEAQTLGVGEIVVNAIDNHGMMKGYDLALVRNSRDATRLSMTVLGGAGLLADIGKLIETCGVVGVAAGSLFVFKGAYKAVLINYQSQSQKEDLVRAALLH